MLFITGTSIGNIEDTTLRAVKTLVSSEIILAEDTQTFDSYYKRIQDLFKVQAISNQKIVHFHKENEFEKLPWVINQLKQNKKVSLVSESGMPLVSDPGSLLLQRVMKEGITYTVIPGPTAFVNATLLSGFRTDQILFLGFLPKKESRIVQMFKQLNNNISKSINPTVVFYESPHRINKTLQIIVEALPNAKLAIAREMTKKFEEIARGKTDELSKRDFKGELTVVISF